MYFLFVIVDLLSNLVFVKTNDDKKGEKHWKKIEIIDEVFIIFADGIITIFLNSIFFQ